MVLAPAGCDPVVRCARGHGWARGGGHAGTVGARRAICRRSGGAERIRAADRSRSGAGRRRRSARARCDRRRAVRTRTARGRLRGTAIWPVLLSALRTGSPGAPGRTPHRQDRSCRRSGRQRSRRRHAGICPPAVPKPCNRRCNSSTCRRPRCNASLNSPCSTARTRSPPDQRATRWRRGFGRTAAKTPAAASTRWRSASSRARGSTTSSCRPAQKGMLRDIAEHLRHRHTVYETWGIGGQDRARPRHLRPVRRRKRHRQDAGGRSASPTRSASISTASISPRS